MDTNFLKHAGRWVLVTSPLQDDEQNTETQQNMHMVWWAIPVLNNQISHVLHSKWKFTHKCKFSPFFNSYLFVNINSQFKSNPFSINLVPPTCMFSAFFSNKIIYLFRDGYWNVEKHSRSLLMLMLILKDMENWHHRTWILV